MPSHALHLHPLPIHVPLQFESEFMLEIEIQAQRNAESYRELATSVAFLSSHSTFYMCVWVLAYPLMCLSTTQLITQSIPDLVNYWDVWRSGDSVTSHRHVTLFLSYQVTDGLLLCKRPAGRLMGNTW